MIEPVAHAEQLVVRYLDHIRTHEPVEATRLGLEERDGELPDLAPEAMAARSRDLAVLDAAIDGLLDVLGALPTGDLVAGMSTPGLDFNALNVLASRARRLPIRSGSKRVAARTSPPIRSGCVASTHITTMSAIDPRMPTAVAISIGRNRADGQVE